MATMDFFAKRIFQVKKLNHEKQANSCAIDSASQCILPICLQAISSCFMKVSESKSLVYSFKKGRRAERTTVGTIINILCGDIPIYWAEVKHCLPLNAVLAGNDCLMSL